MTLPQLLRRCALNIAAVLCAGLFIATIWTRTWRLPVIGIASMPGTGI